MTSLSPSSPASLGSRSACNIDSTATISGPRLRFGSKADDTADFSGKPESEPRVSRTDVAKYLMKSLFKPKNLLRHVLLGGGIGVFIGLFSPLMTLTIPAGIGGAFLLDLGARLFSIATMFCLDPDGQHGKDLKRILQTFEKAMQAEKTKRPAQA